MKKCYTLLLTIVLLWHCNDPYRDSTYQIYDLNPVSTYLESRSDEFSEWIAILKYADLFNAINQATEVFTVFVPDNDAVRKFYAKHKVNSITELGFNYARDLAKFHIISDSINLETFIKGGKLETQTLSEDYLSVSFGEDADDEGGFNSIYVNDEALVTELATAVSNGFVYVLEDVLTPLLETVYDRLEEAGKYSILTEAMTVTGWKDVVNVIYDTTYLENGAQQINKYNFTILAVTDEVYNQDNIYSFNDLVSTLGAGSDYSSSNNALYQYIGYHILTGTWYLEELKSFSTSSDTIRIWGTNATNQVLQISLVGRQYYINYDDIPTSFIEEYTDIVAKNGIIQQIDGYLPIWEPEQTTILWDFCAYPEVKNCPKVEGQVYQEETGTSSEYTTELYTLNLPCFDVELSSSGTSSFGYHMGYLTAKTEKPNDIINAQYKDLLVLNIGYLGSIGMQTPVLIKGKYKVTLQFCYSTSQQFMVQMKDGSNGGQIQISFDGENQKVVAPYSSTVTDVKNLKLHQMVLYDEIEFDTTTDHTFKIVIMDPAASNSKLNHRFQLDYLLFEPIID